MTIGLAVALVACQGAVGKTGEPGPKGEPGDSAPPAPPANQAPISLAVGTIQGPAGLVEEGGDKTMVVSGYFRDPNGDVLSYPAPTADPTGVVRATLAANEAGDQVLTLSPLSAGMAIVTVTATDPGGLSANVKIEVTVHAEGMEPAMYVGSLPTSVALMPGQRHPIPNIRDSFQENEGEDLTFDYTVSGDASSVEVVPAADDDDTFTIIALDVVGNAIVTIIATDEDNLPSDPSYVIEVAVRTALEPALSDMDPGDADLRVGGDPDVRDVAGYFDNHGLAALEYSADSSDDAVAKESIDGSMLTITPMGMGTATVTVTASNIHGSVDAVIMVTVAATPPTRVGSIADVTLTIGGETSVMLAMYFAPGVAGDVLTYTASGGNDMVRASVSGDRLFIEALAAGSADITVTATDADGEIATQGFMVTVTAAPMPDPGNMPPTLKAGMMLGPFKRELNNGAAPESFNLDMYFNDPDGNNALLTYEVKQDKKKENPETADESVIAVGGALWLDQDAEACEAAGTDTPDGDGPEAAPDGNDVGDDILKICYENAGTAEIEITAIDLGGERSDTVTVMITVSDDNSPPAIAAATVTDAVTGDLPDHNTDAATPATARLTIDKRRDVIKDAEFNKYFSDPDLDSRGDADMLTFDVVFLTTEPGDGLHATITGVLAGNTVIGEGDDGYGAVEYVMMPKTWNGDPKAKFTLGLIGRKGTATKAADRTATQVSQIVAIVATDTYGQKFARYFSVGVNHSPMAEGDQAAAADKKTLSGETDMYKDLVVPLTDVADTTALTDANSTATVPLVVAAGGYFSDGDGAGDLADNAAGTGAGCVIKATGGTADVARFEITETAETVSLHILAREIGTKTVTISCRDTFGVESPSDILTVKVTGSLRGSRQ